MPKWRVEFNGAVEVDDAESEEAAIRAGFAKLADDGVDNILFADADPIRVSSLRGPTTEEELVYTKGLVAQYEADAARAIDADEVVRRGKEAAENRQS
jgi:hypothetical protein